MSSLKYWILSGVLALSGNPIASAGHENTPFTLSINTKNAIFKAGSPAGISIILKNESDKELTIHEIGAECDYEVVVRTSDGGPAPKTERGRALEKPGACLDFESSRALSETLTPGQSSSPESVNITDLYEMNKEGTYFVQVRKHRSEDERSRFVESNVIEVTVEGK